MARGLTCSSVDGSGGASYRGQLVPRLLQWTAALLLSVTLGLHWTVLQSVAWTSMVVERSQHETLVSAVKATFDGKHPCEICLLVKAGKSAEQRSTTSFAVQKLEAPSQGSAWFWVGRLDLEATRIAQVPSWARRPDGPPVPPPRNA